MKLLVFDTETTGLPPRGQTPSVSNIVYWPFNVQISFLGCDTETCKLTEGDFIIKLPDNETIPKESSDIHGITNEIMKEKGVDIKKALDKFLDLYTNCDVLIAHNIEFDLNMLRAAFLRNGYERHIFKNSKVIKVCTMKSTINFCNLNVKSTTNGDKYKKWPKLVELHNKIFKTNFENMHNSLADVYACFRCYYRLKFGKDFYKDKPEEFEKYKLICGV
tara:strand:- start:121 stop:777 length:657 start_codon:yes stop_codon:yes gene_type:complete